MLIEAKIMHWHLLGAAHMGPTCLTGRTRATLHLKSGRNVSNRDSQNQHMMNNISYFNQFCTFLFQGRTFPQFCPMKDGKWPGRRDLKEMVSDPVLSSCKWPSTWLIVTTYFELDEDMLSVTDTDLFILESLMAARRYNQQTDVTRHC